jgi:hypothetical protein
MGPRQYAGSMRVGMIDTRGESAGSKLDERRRRVFAAGEVRAARWGGLAAVSAITGPARSTIGETPRCRAFAEGPGPPQGRRRTGHRDSVNVRGVLSGGFILVFGLLYTVTYAQNEGSAMDPRGYAGICCGWPARASRSTFLKAVDNKGGQDPGVAKPRCPLRAGRVILRCDAQGFGGRGLEKLPGGLHREGPRRSSPPSCQRASASPEPKARLGGFAMFAAAVSEMANAGLYRSHEGSRLIRVG